jgi:1,4-dihydroxy-2-naphthoyl-CoA hydrolase
MTEERRDPAAALAGTGFGDIEPYGDLAKAMGIEYVEISPERVVGRMPVTGNTQPFGLLHGGASCVLAETLGSMGAAAHAGPGRFPVGIEINATHHRAADAGWVTGVATRMHGGRTLATYEIVISDDAGRRVCTARLTCMLRDRPGNRPGDGPGDGQGGKPAN